MNRGPKPWLLMLSLGLSLALSACGPAQPAKLTLPAKTICGAWFAPHGDDGYLSPRGLGQMDHLRQMGANWVAYAPEPRMAAVDQAHIDYVTDHHEELKVILALKQRGLKVMLMPRIESPAFFRTENPLGRGDIAMKSPESWARFHKNITAMTVSYAKLAERAGVDLFCLGLEYRESTVNFPTAWRQLIRTVRKHFHGPVTYSANWYGEYDKISFWRDLDYVGIGAYFPICEKRNAALPVLRKGWKVLLEKLEKFANRVGKPLLFTEIGYPAFDVAGAKPWEWTTKAGKSINHGHQADCFRAFFATIQDRPSIAGCFIWRFHTDMRYVKDWEYCPQGREAEDVIEENFKRLLK